MLVKENSCINLVLNPMLFAEAYAEVLNELDTQKNRTHHDVDYFDLCNCVGGGIDSSLKKMFETQDFTVVDSKGNEIPTWDSFIFKN